MLNRLFPRKKLIVFFLILLLSPVSPRAHAEPSSHIIQKVDCVPADNRLFSGEKIKFTAVLKNGADSGGILYRYFIKEEGKDWVVVRDFSDDASWEWKPENTGKYAVEVHARRFSSSDEDAFWVGNFFVGKKKASQNTYRVDYKPAKSRLLPGDRLDFHTAAVLSGPGEEILYQYLVKAGDRDWTVARDFSKDASWTWEPKDAGTYSLEVHMRRPSAPEGFEDSFWIGQFIVHPAPITRNLEIAPDHPSYLVGEKIELKTVPFDPKLKSRYFVKYENKDWRPFTGWVNNKTVSFILDAPGSYAFQSNVLDESGETASAWLGMITVKGNPARDMDKLSLEELYDIFGIPRASGNNDFICDYVMHNRYDATVFDKNGIPMLAYSGEEGQPAGAQYSPEYISRYALSDLCLYKEKGDKKFIDQSRKYIAWLTDNFKPKGTYGYWTYDFPYKPRKPFILDAGWPSALSQGLGLAALGRIYAATKDPKYHQLAERALRGFEVPVEKGGILRTAGDGYWYEEYPTEKPSYVLNGFLVSLLCLHDYYLSTHEQHAEYLFQRGMHALTGKIGQFEVEKDGVILSAYDLADGGYNLLFRLLKNGPAPLLIRKISLVDKDNRELASIDVGGDNDTSREGSFVWSDPANQKWGKSMVDSEGNTYRDANYYQKTNYNHSPFTLSLDKWISSPSTLKIEYQNGDSDARIEIFNGTRYRGIGSIPSKGADGQWKTASLSIESDLVSAIKANQGRNVDIRYHDNNILLLNDIYAITKEKSLLPIIKRGLPAFKLVPSLYRHTRKELLTETSTVSVAEDSVQDDHADGEKSIARFLEGSEHVVCGPFLVGRRGRGTMRILYLSESQGQKKLQTLTSENGYTWSLDRKKNIIGDLKDIVSMDIKRTSAGAQDSIYVSDGKEVRSYSYNGQLFSKMNTVLISDFAGNEFALSHIRHAGFGSRDILFYQTFDQDKYLLTNIAFTKNGITWYKLVANPVYTDWNRVEQQFQLDKVLVGNTSIHIYYTSGGDIRIKSIDKGVLLKYMELTERIHENPDEKK